VGFVRNDERTVSTDVLDVGYVETGPADGPAVVLLHGFPYDVRSYLEVAPMVAAAGARVIVPFLRGYGRTRFRSAETLRSGQQAALGHDLLELLDALGIARAVVGGYDWGGRAACVLAALRPDRVAGLVTVDGYNVQDIARSGEPATAVVEKAKWYQHYFQTAVGRRGLEQHRDDICRLLWRDWSPTWERAEQAYALSAPSLDHPDFVDVVIHSYRHRFGNVAGDPAYQPWEDLLARQPAISVPTVSLAPQDDGFGALAADADRDHFTGPFTGLALPGIGHNPPQEDPAGFARAVVSLLPQVD